jgi:hypothetical protein
MAWQSTALANQGSSQGVPAAHHSEDNLGTLRTSSYCRPPEGSQEGRQNGASAEVSRDLEREKRSRKRAGLLTSNLLGARGCPKRILPKSANCFEILVSAAGFEPATLALKGHSDDTTSFVFQ